MVKAVKVTVFLYGAGNGPVQQCYLGFAYVSDVKENMNMMKLVIYGPPIIIYIGWTIIFSFVWITMFNDFGSERLCLCDRVFSSKNWVYDTNFLIWDLHWVGTWKTVWVQCRKNWTETVMGQDMPVHNWYSQPILGQYKTCVQNCTWPVQLPVQGQYGPGTPMLSGISSFPQSSPYVLKKISPKSDSCLSGFKVTETLIFTTEASYLQELRCISDLW